MFSSSYCLQIASHGKSPVVEEVSKLLNVELISSMRPARSKYSEERRPIVPFDDDDDDDGFVILLNPVLSNLI